MKAWALVPLLASALLLWEGYGHRGVHIERGGSYANYRNNRVNGSAADVPSNFIDGALTKGHGHCSTRTSQRA